MKKFVLLFTTLVLTACGSAAEVENDELMSMDDLPCHQMPDGSWMGDCSDENHDHEPGMEEHDHHEDHEHEEGTLPHRH